ncbi:hypothetical protein [Burkholderia sp. BCC0419]|uniref:hypothetical protein n=1 Tax=Burkholderia sp. BCC0419 TaxID=486878 RepID=UPI00158BA7B8|nr:hypothetical protein [Burkholderia sp. BCC0419]
MRAQRTVPHGHTHLTTRPSKRTHTYFDLNMVDSATGSGSTSQASTTFPATIAAASWDRQAITTGYC